jgi:hypothetical protein
LVLLLFSTQPPILRVGFYKTGPLATGHFSFCPSQSFASVFSLPICALSGPGVPLEAPANLEVTANLSSEQIAKIGTSKFHLSDSRRPNSRTAACKTLGDRPPLNLKKCPVASLGTSLPDPPP